MDFGSLPAQSPVIKLNGRQFARQLVNMSPWRRALLTHDLKSGTVEVTRPTTSQALKLTGASSGYLRTESRLSDAERQRLKYFPHLLSTKHNRGELSDVDVDRMLNRIGLRRALERIDFLTALTPKPAPVISLSPSNCHPWRPSEQGRRLSFLREDRRHVHVSQSALSRAGEARLAYLLGDDIRVLASMDCKPLDLPRLLRAGRLAADRVVAASDDAIVRAINEHCDMLETRRAIGCLAGLVATRKAALRFYCSNGS